MTGPAAAPRPNRCARIYYNSIRLARPGSRRLGPSTHVLADTWTSWYFNRAYPYSPAHYECLKSSANGYTNHQLYILEYRRDLVRSSTICPSCPSCVGCYYHQEVIDYQLSDVSCLNDTHGLCGSGRTPGCYELCAPSSVCN
jgi:hypothetical protein